MGTRKKNKNDQFQIIPHTISLLLHVGEVDYGGDASFLSFVFLIELIKGSRDRRAYVEKKRKFPKHSLWRINLQFLVANHEAVQGLDCVRCRKRRIVAHEALIEMFEILVRQ